MCAGEPNGSRFTIEYLTQLHTADAICIRHVNLVGIICCAASVIDIMIIETRYVELRWLS